MPYFLSLSKPKRAAGKPSRRDDLARPGASAGTKRGGAIGAIAARSAPGRDTIATDARAPQASCRSPRTARSDDRAANRDRRVRLEPDPGQDDGADVYEALALLTLESLATLAGKDPAGFDHLLGGLAVYACAAPRLESRLRSQLAVRDPTQS
jgi:hypothetical protein